MSTLFTALELLVVLVLGFLLTTRVIPWIFVKIMRRLGFRMILTPVMAKRIQRFKSIRRGYYSFLAISTLFVISLFLELLINNKALLIYYNGRLAAPAVVEWLDEVVFFVHFSAFQPREDFGQIGKSEVDYRYFQRCVRHPELVQAKIKECQQQLAQARAVLAQARPPKSERVALGEYWLNRRAAQRKIKRLQKDLPLLQQAYEVFQQGRAWIIMPLYPYSPNEHLLDLPGRPPHRPFAQHPLGTDDSGADVLAQLCYGFRVSLAFALVVAACGYSIGVIVGGIMGYYGGWIDILIQRFIEIWSSIPFLFTIMILASIIKPTFLVMAILLVILRSWLGITYTIRGEFYREKAKDYVQAAIAIGSSDWKVMTRHILPNSLVPVVSFAPFGIVAYITSLAFLDYLGYGLPLSTPSWGRLLQQGKIHILQYPHLILVPSIALALTLFAVVMIGEAVREAFDPKVFSRLR